MRGVAVVAGGLLLLGGTVLIAVADQQRVDALAEARAAVVQAEERLELAREVNLRLAEQLTALRTTIAEQETLLTDTSGFLP
ncbi:hypothetical protein BMW26_03130 [Microbacterium sp. 1.5R]|uniref:hypothetical protein n=1 Tax=unclassified Microbacterium TaxID=2609290 RepID=UPI0006A2C6CF|nr:MULTISPECIES: hypothetical protein [unclassified Microbacterium]AKV87557.1 hypothetical protein AKG07_16015 [Microbacterium sp. CGR1]APH44069.1 hypothetical protein BMW26_03130 [Microbacterium sp. 1.5R]MBC6495269.1 hypothetical protein [Microbacterium sp. 4-7]MDY0985236.1 hypothetical protein [Microbacterium sp. CFBP9023]CAH0227791.1 hypothetical protein SRABI98_02665 [Microbacterium sp. Bi98]